MIIKSKHYFLPAIFLSSLIIGIFLFTKQRQPIFPQALCKDCNVILITMTNLRYDHMSSNGYFRATTPNLDAFAKESIVFNNAFSHASWTAPARVSLYTGLYPFQHGYTGRRDGSSKTLPQEIPTILDVLKNAGYTTAAFTGAGTGVKYRVDEHQECGPDIGSPYQKVSQRYRNNGSIIFKEFSCVIPKALAWLKNNTSDKFFLHVQGYDLHCPFSQRGGYTFDKDYKGNIDFSSCFWSFDRSEPVLRDGKKYYLVYSPEGAQRNVLLGEDDIKHLIALYDESIKFTDENIGLLLKSIKDMGLNEKTIIVFTSEHGEIFGKYGQFMRGGTRGTFYDDVLHTPLIIRHPKLNALQTSGLVSHIDVPQTILDFLGLGELNGYGKSMVPLIVRGEEVRKEVFAGTIMIPRTPNIFLSNRSYIAVIRTKEWKLVEESTADEDGSSSKNIELFDIVNDKEELHNLASERKDILAKMQGQLSNWLKTVR